MIRRHSSGSLCSASSIEPITSANSTVTCLRSPSRVARPARIFSARCSGGWVRGSGAAIGAAAPASAWPQLSQYFVAGGWAVPQEGHVTVSTRGVAHPAQKRAPSRFRWPQDGQSMSSSGRVPVEASVLQLSSGGGATPAPETTPTSCGSPARESARFGHTVATRAVVQGRILPFPDGKAPTRLGRRTPPPLRDSAQSEPAGQGGFEPPTSGFGDQRSTS